MRFAKLSLFLGLCLAVAAVAAWPITHVEVKQKCPICGTENTFIDYASWGSYIYMWPSRFQFIFWPYTDETFLHHCKRCHFSVFKPDFEKVPSEKLEATRSLVAGVSIPKPPEEKTVSKEEQEYLSRVPYLKIPMSARLEVAEKVYELWGRDDDFWCHFYRVKGYHLQKEGKQEEADAARQKALNLALKMLTLEKNQGRRKELLLITAAMRHYLRDEAGALADLNAAEKLTYNDPALEEEKNRNVDGYLSKLIKDYIEAIVQGRSTDERSEL